MLYNKAYYSFSNKNWQELRHMSMLFNKTPTETKSKNVILYTQNIKTKIPLTKCISDPIMKIYS